MSVQLFVVAATQAKSTRAEQNPHQQESTTQTNDGEQWLCGVAMHVTSSYHTCGIHAINCAIQRPRATGTGSENPKGRKRGLALLDITFALVSWSCHSRAAAQAQQKLATFDLQIVHRAIRFDTSSGPSSSANSSSYFSFKCVVVNRSRSMQPCLICTHESLKSFAGALVVTCIFGSGSITLGRANGRQVEFSCLSRAQPSTANAPN